MLAESTFETMCYGNSWKILSALHSQQVALAFRNSCKMIWDFSFSSEETGVGKSCLFILSADFMFYFGSRPG